MISFSSQAENLRMKMVERMWASFGSQLHQASIHAADQYFVGSYYVLGTVLGGEGTSVSKSDMASDIIELRACWGEGHK